MIFLSDGDLEKVEAASSSFVDRLTKFDEVVCNMGFCARPCSMIFDMAKFKQPSKTVIEVSKTNIKFTETIRILTNKYVYSLN